jgi:hypothetical protein
VGDKRNSPSAASIWFNPDTRDKVAWVQRRISTWGWFEVDVRPEALDIAAQGWTQAFQDLVVYPSAWTFARYEHIDRGMSTPASEQLYKPRKDMCGNNEWWQSTKAVQQHALDKNNGIVLFQPDFLPKFAGKNNWKQDPGADNLPKMTAAADFLWYGWYGTDIHGGIQNTKKAN